MKTLQKPGLLCATLGLVFILQTADRAAGRPIPTTTEPTTTLNTTPEPSSVTGNGTITPGQTNASEPTSTTGNVTTTTPGHTNVTGNGTATSGPTSGPARIVTTTVDPSTVPSWMKILRRLNTTTAESGLEEHDSDADGHDHHETTPARDDPRSMPHTTPSGMRHPYGYDSFGVLCLLGYDCSNAKPFLQTHRPDLLVRNITYSLYLSRTYNHRHVI
ncbi:protein O10 [Aotine betaherpesvirus 1]|uniref:Protein O10 n=1 Tax=Aotine betaherpesvirus 1 TaxID=50290 RepID=G8XU97_9BETA|nr:protein O10 [Aotine betaherpesvirus 1]AEV80728.1 protein O10 [Aotine betaherpesvirus 1]